MRLIMDKNNYWSCSYYYFLLFTLVLHGARAEEKRFVVVSRSYNNFYPDIVEARPDQEEPNVDIKKQICADVIGSYLFSRLEERHQKKEIDVSRLSRYLGRANDFQYPEKTIPITLPDISDGVIEVAFVCMTKNGRGEYKKYYISYEYNLNTGKQKYDDASKIAGRFIFHEISSISKETGLFGVAEVPATVHETRISVLETTYLERRAEFVAVNSTPRIEEEDPLCKLGVEDVHRMCQAVFSSEHFEKRISPLSADVRFEGHCKLMTLSFRTPSEQLLAVKSASEEWLLSCDPRPRDAESRHTSYLLSHAYKPHQIFVYVRYKERKSTSIFLYALMNNIRIAFDHQFRPRNLNPQSSKEAESDSRSRL